MKKWKVAQQRMAWQGIGDRNIGGHTAYVPDTISFLPGPGPRGVGFDLSRRSAILELAQVIVPPTEDSKDSQLGRQLEARWLEHHGHRKRPTRPTTAPVEKKIDPVRRMFNRSIIRKDSLGDLMSELRSAVMAAEDRERREREEAERLDAERLEAALAADTEVDEEDGKEKAVEGAGNALLSMLNNSRERKHVPVGKVDVMISKSDETVQEKTNRAMNEILGSARVVNFFNKRREAKRSKAEALSTGEQKELLSILEKEVKQKTAPMKMGLKIKKVAIATGVMSRFNKHVFVPAQVDQYNLPEGQSFTRRRTKGNMYESVEDSRAVTLSPTHLEKRPLTGISGRGPTPRSKSVMSFASSGH